ncbi:winged helix-turn-helix transcriptional regulator [Luteolibacter pohnpeiensis]|uniref:Winged helix-turn-helix transcriptional regulator n=1 Tax=Luteolibacter pohnpeiensis TaxID=454153 RepID=A0A934VPB6_9BACT|nr:MarR family winged helix-turn-helix transcriptional regulator [Luteolibacter pohnpeiensis]MBK1880821.1 winged helix-turn-helix transcriptional regulator [Luteolibacter pohnpeiensis]
MSRSNVDKVNRKKSNQADEVFESIHHLMHQFRSEQYRMLRDGPYEMTHMEGKLMGYFAHNPGSTLRELVEFTGKDKGQLARLIRSLKDQGLLEGEENAKDKRSVRLSLTSEGNAIHDALRKQLSRVSKIAVAGLDADELRQLISMLNRIKGNLEESRDKE